MNGNICEITDKGYFFIKGQDGQQYFAHRSALQQQTWIYHIELGDEVAFDPTENEKGPRAENVMVNRLAAA